jgi:16S rRNA (uracil1498-N3)-methyltransferase
VNLLLFTASEASQPLPRLDPRAVHLLDVLRRQIGDSFDAGIVNGPRGKGFLCDISPESLSLSFIWGNLPPRLAPLVLLIGTPRPQTARRILQEATAMGVREMHFFQSARGESSYAQSTLWSSGEWRRHLISGAEQAFCTHLPEVNWARSLADVVGGLSPAQATQFRCALDNYEASLPLGQCDLASAGQSGPLDREIVVAVGSERGWSDGERKFLRSSGFTLAQLGTRVLRTETAITAGLAILKAKLGLM